jgi:hypothetical protein
MGAKAELRNALALVSSSALSHGIFGTILDAKGDTVGAETECRATLALEPKGVYAH